MAVRREAGYRSLGYRAASREELDPESAAGTRELLAIEPSLLV
jgi:hypothetical protein